MFCVFYAVFGAHIGVGKNIFFVNNSQVIFYLRIS